MADYHPLIARAVAGLDKNTGENRRALYERARVALVAQLRGVVPALEESEITRERLALEEAIRKVEAESARQAREAARPTFIKRADLPQQPRTLSTPLRPSQPDPQRPSQQRPSPQRPSRTDQETRRPPMTPGEAAADIAPPSAAPPDPAPPRPAYGARRDGQDDPLKGFGEPQVAPESQAEPYDHSARVSQRPSQGYIPPAPERYEPQAPRPPEPHPLQEYGQLEPQVQPDNLWRETPVDYDEAHPPRTGPTPPPEHPEDEVPHTPPRSYAGLIRSGIILVLIGVVAAVVWTQRGNIASMASSVVALFGPSANAPQRETTAPARPKITDRIGQPSPQAGPPVAQRVVLYEEDPEDPQGKRFVGTVVWRTESRPASQGRPQDISIRGDIDIPDRKMTMTWSLRRNTDQSLPASHTIEIVFNLPPDSPVGGVQNVPGVLMKQSESTRGVPLAGLAVKVTPGFFLIGLSSLETDVQRNVQLLKERSWFDIPIVYNNNRRAILAMEKGPPGEKAFNEAFAAWKQ